MRLLNKFFIKIKIIWLNFIHNREWAKWEKKYITIIDGKKNYTNWPICPKATPEWKNRVQRVKKIIELQDRYGSN